MKSFKGSDMIQFMLKILLGLLRGEWVSEKQEIGRPLCNWVRREEMGPVSITGRDLEGTAHSNMT